MEQQEHESLRRWIGTRREQGLALIVLLLLLGASTFVLLTGRCDVTAHGLPVLTPARMEAARAS